MNIDDGLHLVFLRRKEEGFKISNIVDDGVWHWIDSGLDDVFPRLRGFLNINVRWGTDGSIGERLGKGEHVFED